MKNIQKMNKIKYGRVLTILSFLIIVIPICTIFLWVFTERFSWPSLLPNTYSLRALRSIFRNNSEIRATFVTSIVLSIVVATISVAIAILTARAICFYKLRLSWLFKFMIILPFLVPTTVFAMGIQISFIRLNLSGNIYGVIICHVIYSLPYATRLIEDGMKGLSMRLEEQARVLGATEIQAFFYVSLKNLIPIILSAFTMSYIVSFSQYFLTLLIGGGNVKTFTVLMVPFLQSGERNIASVYSTIFIIITLIIFLIFDKLAILFMKGREVEYYR